MSSLCPAAMSGGGNDIRLMGLALCWPGCKSPSHRVPVLMLARNSGAGPSGAGPIGAGPSGAKQGGGRSVATLSESPMSPPPPPSSPPPFTPQLSQIEQRSTYLAKLENRHQPRATSIRIRELLGRPEGERACHRHVTRQPGGCCLRMKPWPS